MGRNYTELRQILRLIQREQSEKRCHIIIPCGEYQSDDSLLAALRLARQKWGGVQKERTNTNGAALKLPRGTVYEQQILNYRPRLPSYLPWKVW